MPIKSPKKTIRKKCPKQFLIKLIIWLPQPFSNAINTTTIKALIITKGRKNVQIKFRTNFQKKNNNPIPMELSQKFPKIFRRTLQKFYCCSRNSFRDFWKKLTISSQIFSETLPVVKCLFHEWQQEIQSEILPWIFFLEFHLKIFSKILQWFFS